MLLTLTTHGPFLVADEGDSLPIGPGHLPSVSELMSDCLPF